MKISALQIMQKDKNQSSFRPHRQHDLFLNIATHSTETLATHIASAC